MPVLSKSAEISTETSYDLWGCGIIGKAVLSPGRGSIPLGSTR
jgi:hypothetical protein